MHSTNAPGVALGSGNGASTSSTRLAGTGIGAHRRLLVISHPAIVTVNQEVYRELSARGWKVTIIVPDRWRHAYSNADVRPQPLEELRSAMWPTSVAFRGRPQRHLYLTSCRSLIKQAHPDVAFVEAEPFALATFQWARALLALNIPFGVQCAENIDRTLPWPVRMLRSHVLRTASFVAARSESAASLARQWGACGSVALSPHAVPAWEQTERHRGGPPPAGERPFTVGYAGRLVESKGLLDLLAAVRMLEAPVELLLIGNGELREKLEHQSIPGSTVRVLADVTHEQMADRYSLLDVLVLPSRTTPTWKEQFGRVIVEALWCGVPVIGSSSGEIPWLIELTGGGLVFDEGDAGSLAAHLRTLRAQPLLREEFARVGREAVRHLFSVPAATDSLERLLDPASVTSSRIAG